MGSISVLAMFLRTLINEEAGLGHQALFLALMVNMALVFVLWPSNRELTQRLARRYHSLAEELGARTPLDRSSVSG